MNGVRWLLLADYLLNCEVLEKLRLSKLNLYKIDWSIVFFYNPEPLKTFPDDYRPGA